MKKLKQFWQNLSANGINKESRGYVQTYRIDGISDVFDGAQIWSNSIAFPRQAHLDGLLDAHAQDEFENRVFTHIEILIPVERYRDDMRISNGKRSKALSECIAALLRKSFAKQIPADATVRVAVSFGQDLPKASVEARFGHAIYVPDAEELTVWKIEWSADGLDWSSAEMQQNQRLFLLGGSGNSATVVAGDWPLPMQAAVMLTNDPNNPALTIEAEPCGSLKVELDKKLGYHVIQSDDTVYYLRTTRMIPFERPKPKPVVIKLREERTEAGILVSPAKASRGITLTASRQDVRTEPKLDNEKPAGNTAERTFIPQTPANDMHTYLPTTQSSRPSTLTLIGIALQRVSAFQAHNIRGFGFGFNSAADIVPVYGQPSPAVLSFQVDESDNMLVVSPRTTRPIGTGEVVPLQGTSGISLEAVPEPMQALHLAFCKIPKPVIGRIDKSGTGKFGRLLPDLKNLRLLSGSGFIDQDEQESSDRMGVSRIAFEYQVGADGLQITLHGNQQIGHLDDQLQFVAMLSRTDDNTPITIPNNHHLVVGHYLLRYDA